MTFRFEINLLEIGFGAPAGTMKLMKRHRRIDPDLFWVPDAYGQKLAKLARRRADVVFLGDSCTELGDYPERVLLALRRRQPGRKIIGEELGASGWSTFQGLQQLRRDIAPLRPRIVTFYYGWNDHWMGSGFEDRDIHAMTVSVPEAVRRLRLSQLLFKTRLVRATASRDDWPVRVPADRFRDNLREMIQIARASESVPVLLTAPTSHREGSEPPHLALHWIRDLSDLVPIHRQYVDITRSVAREQNVALCDLAANFDALLEDASAATYFSGDGIHLTPAGNQEIADRLLECLSSTAELRAVWGESRSGLVSGSG